MTAGDDETARTLYAQVRTSRESIEPVAGSGLWAVPPGMGAREPHVGAALFADGGPTIADV